MPLDRMPQGEFCTHAVAIASSVSLALYVAGGFEVAHDPLHGALGDSNACGDVFHERVAVSREAKKHMRMIGEERPIGAGLRARGLRLR